MLANKNLAVVLSHGSYHTPEPYKPLLKALQSHGIESYCPQRPTCDLIRLNVGDIDNPDFNREPPVGGYPSDTEDVDVTIRLLDRLINNENKLVLLAGHSSGGWVATQAAVPELQIKSRQAQGKAGGIIGLFYIGAFIIPLGESLTSFVTPKDADFTQRPVPHLQFFKYGMDGLWRLKDPQHFMLHDIDPEEAEIHTAKLTAAPTMTVSLTNDAYLALPCAFLITENDRLLPKEYQEHMIALQTERGTQFTVYRAPSGHSPHLSWTAGLVEKMEEFANALKPWTSHSTLTSEWRSNIEPNRWVAS
ncbi:alpha/beta-hydrolase [Aspergillus ellipticus CBS 707.79]|uniref:Alpha/beta-hydrolase n=1 Tax=Aspergillus ellipticus CBS 707.79 TaxID=1448320 RepID=A0A319D8X1_9EURO|nr:alpha/beta-hydrolase [Aspergillus ellipticus CBS 707.79]